MSKNYSHIESPDECHIESQTVILTPESKVFKTIAVVTGKE